MVGAPAYEVQPSRLVSLFPHYCVDHFTYKNCVSTTDYIAVPLGVDARLPVQYGAE